MNNFNKSLNVLFPLSLVVGIFVLLHVKGFDVVEFATTRTPMQYIVAVLGVVLFVFTANEVRTCSQRYA